MRRFIVILFIAFMSMENISAIIIRHDVDDQKYLDLGQEYSSSVAYIRDCAGTLIESDWVLTAAHCVQGREESIVLARHIDKEYRVEKLLVHPKYSSGENQQHDIALIQLKEFVKNGNPAKLYNSKDEKGKPVVFVGRGGYGNGRDGKIEEDGKERGSTNTVIDTSEQWIEFLFDAPENATVLEGISGSGDSGGPAFITIDSQLYVAGVSSYQLRNGNEKSTYGVSEYYARVSSNIEWIESVINGTEKAASLPVHPIIDAIKSDDETQLREVLTTEILSDEIIMEEAFIQSVILDRVSLAEDLIMAGADVGSVGINQLSLFEFAILAERPEYVKMLIFKTRHLENIHSNNSRVLPLLVFMLGADPHVLEAVNILLDQGANINSQNLQGDTAVLLASWFTDNLDLITVLVERGADVNIRNDSGNTPLMASAYQGKNGILGYLLKNGADIDIKNSDGESAKSMALERKDIMSMWLIFFSMWR